MFISYFEIDMILIYILSILSISSLFIDKTETVQVNKSQEVVTEHNQKAFTKVKKISNSDLDNSWVLLNEDLSWNMENMMEVENSGILENDEYEEIIFQDNFDKEYWSGTEDNYLED